MWDLVRRLGFDGGQVFEPGMGVGNFPATMPADVAACTHYAGLELDHITARIARALYPRWGVRQDDFTRTPLPRDTFDLVIGNPPFADIPIRSDSRYPQGFLLHDYFFAKSLDAVRPGGLLAFVTSAGTMNKADASAREYLADRADLVGAIRLPGAAFEKTAHTSVTTDIVVLRKRLEGELAGDRSWTETVEVTLPNKHGQSITGRMSRYFAENPEMVLGEQGFFDPLYENRYAVRGIKGQPLDKALARAIEQFPENVMAEGVTQDERAEIDFGTDQKKDGSFYFDGERLMQVRDGVGVPVKARGKGQAGIPKEHIERIRGLVPIRDALRAVYAADLAGQPDNAKVARQRLNEAYDAFVERFGPINKLERQYRRPTIVQQEAARAEAREEARYAGELWHEGDFDASGLIAEGASLTKIAAVRKAAREQAEREGRSFDEGSFDPAAMEDLVIEKRENIDPFMDDPESYRLRAIERYNDETGEVTKGGVFRENIITRERAPEIRSVNDAMLHVLNRKGRLDIPEIAALSGKSQTQAIEELGESIFKLPGTEDTYVLRDAYLSGNVREKLRRAEAAAEKNPEFERNVAALEAVQPVDLTPSEISATLGAPWIPEAIVERFATDGLGLRTLTARYTPKLAYWEVSGDKGSAASTAEWGTADLSATELIEHALNRRTPQVTRSEKLADGTRTTWVDTEATQAAQDKLKTIKEKFSTWAWEDEGRAAELAEIYNEQFNSTVVREYDGSYLTTPGVSSAWQWRPHQKRVIARIIQSGNTYMAHGVGAGKTSAMIGSGMEMRRLGLVKKPMYVVPNHMLAQFTKEFYEQYPTARIAVADERRFHTSRRKQFIANVASEDLDAIIITHSAFGMIPVSNEFQDGLIQQQIDDYRELLEQMDKDAENRITRSRLQKQIERLEQRLTGKAEKATDQVFTFEEMGVDFLFVDEAHYFRKLDFATKMSGVKGVSPEGSKASWDLYAKSRHLERVNPGQNLVLASGTAVTNTMAELYTISRYLQPQELEARGLSHFDAWAGAFGDTVTDLEQDAAGNYKSVTRFAKFVNVPELSNMVRQNMDVVTSQQLGEYVTRPRLRGGKRQMNLAERSEALVEYQAKLAARMEAIERRKGPPEPGDDIMLSVINDGRHAAIDMRLADREVSEDPGSKLNMLIDNVAEIHRRTSAQPFYEPRADGYSETPVDAGPATQMIFANLGLSGTRGFSVPNYIRAELARRGVPRSEIADIRDYKTHAARQRLFNDVNEGKVRVLIGSTAKMSTGVNAQRRLYAVHNLDPLWYPADDEQRNGRILRQGNMNPEIEIHDYSTKGTYDSTMWQMMERKARFIEGFFRGDPTLRDMDDLGEASQYEQAKALSTADPRIMQLTELRQNLEREQRRKAAHQREQSVIRQRINRAQMSRQASENRIPRIEEDIAQRQDTSGEAFTAKIGDQAFTDRLEAGQAMLQRIEELKQGQGMAPPKKIGEIGGFDIMATVWGTHERFADVGLKRAGDYSADVRVTGSARGLIQSLEHQLRGFESEIEHHRKRITEAEQEVREYESRLSQEYDGAERLEDLQGQVRALEAELARESQEGGEAGGSEERYARGPYHDPWIGMVPRQGPSEHYTQRQGDAVDWHHSNIVVDMDAYEADSTLRYVRYGDAHEVRISGSPALAPYGRGRAQIRRMATEMVERGTPGDVRLRVDDMALGHEMEGVDLGALRDWAEGPSLKRSSTLGQGLPVEQARRHVAAVSAGWNGPRLETVQSVRDLPADIHALAEQAGALEDMRGVYYRGVIYLVADRHDSAQALERTLLHEAVGHYGLRNLLGTRIRPVLNQVWAATGGVKGNQSIIDSYFQPGTFDPQNATHRAIIAEERLAQMAEDGTHAGIIERAVAALREWLRGLGLTIRLNDADLRALLRRAHRSLEAQTPDQMAGEAAFARRGQEGTEALDRQRQVSEGIRKGAPVDRLFSAVFDLTGSTDEYGRFRPGVQLTEQIRKTLHERTVDPEGTFGRWLHPLVERGRAGLIDRYGVPESFIQRDAARESESRRILGQMEGLVEQIQKADLSREERLVLQRVLDEGEVPTEALESLSTPIRAALDDLTGQMIELGLIKADSAITDWLHRSYQKHEAELSGLPKWMHQAQRKHRKKIGGDSLRMRGLKEEVTTERLLRNVPRDWWGRKLRPGQADTHLVGTEWVMLDRLEPTPEGMDPLTGMDPAQPTHRRVRERVFWPADRELPARFDTWENRGTFEVAGARGDKLILRRDFTRAEREDMGQVLDVRYNLIKSFQLLAHDISSARFFSDIAKNPDWATHEPTTETGEAPEIVNAEEARRLSTFVGVDWVRVPETRVAKGAKAFKWGDLAGMYVRPEIWRDLNELDIMQTPGTWRKLLTHWKLNKALALDTPIPTADGWTTMGEIQEGDTLFDENGKPCTVLEVKDVQHGRPCYRVEFSDGTSIVADDEHWWFTNHRNDGGAVRTTEEIRNTLTINHRGEAAHSIRVAGALELPDADLPLPPYALGVWLGDGHKRSPRLYVGGQDLEEVVSNLESSGVVCTAPIKDKRNNVYSFTIQKQPGRCIRGHDDSHRNPKNCGECEREARREKSIGEPMSPVVNADFGDRMRDLGVIGDKHIPGEYLRASQQQRLELLQGIVDSDGCITTKGECIIISSSERLARGIKELVTSLGYKPTLRPSESRLNGECVGTHWRIYFRPNTDRPVATIRRKAERIRPASVSRRRSGNRQIVSITPVDSVPVRCIAVSSESHLYLAGDGMVPTHNTARSPVVHVNNVMSNLGLMDLIDVRVRDLAAGIREFAHKGPMYQEAREHGAFGGTFVHQEIQRDVLAPIVDEMLAEARRGEESMGGRVRFLSQLGYRLWDGVKKADRRMVDFYQVEDEIFRMGTYMRLRGMGMDAPEAARQARVQFLDYNIRAPWVNAARQSVLPFISYTYRAAPAIATAIAHRPWKLAKYITIGYLTNLLAFELEPGDEDEERRTMRPEVQGMTWASIPFTDIGWNRMVRLPWRDQYDNPMYIDIMRWVPAGDVFDTQQGVTGVPAWLQMGGPLQIGFELYLNKQNFTGQEIYDPLASDWQDRLNARIGYLWRAYVPSGAYIPGSWHNASLMSALRGERDLLDRPASIPQSLASGVGIKARGHDVDLGYWFRSMEIDQRRRALHAERRALERDYRRNAISYPAYNRAVRRVEAKTDHLSSAAAAIAPR
ncbi:LAGLIDADG family homing endonuclease [Halorhodospira sp. 9622]|uniref:LAGLIDADG family homing endonuclease n=1 Tax=Halorhodospira sp. 9622 TaxID=2899136 RepID=UPI00351CD3F9